VRLTEISEYAILLAGLKIVFLTIK